MKLKKVLTLALAVLMALSVLTACGGTKKPTANGSSQPNGNSQAEVQVTEESALKLLEKVWAAFSNDQKFAVMGGDAAAGVTDNAGSFSLKDASAVDSMLGVPEASVGKITEAASIIHMMNANNFTGAAFKTADEKTAKELAGEIEKHLSGRQWICGFPEKLYIATTADGFVISAFGAGDIMSVFTEKLTDAYKVDVVVDKNLG